MYDEDKLLKTYKAIWTRIEDLQNIELDTLPVYDDRYIKTKIKTHGDKVYTNFPGLNVPEDGVECKSFSHFYFLIICDSFLLIHYLCMTTNITCKYIQTTMHTKL